MILKVVDKYSKLTEIQFSIIFIENRSFKINDQDLVIILQFLFC